MAIAAPMAANAEAVQVFTVQTAQPSTIDFRGLGTATYNNSTGTSNGITLGSTSSFNVANSLSASKEYTGATSALVQFTGEEAANRTNFQQSIGTSAGAANSISAAESTATSAHSTASAGAARATTALFGDTFGEYQNNFNLQAATTLDASGNQDMTALIQKTGKGTDASGNTTDPTLAGNVVAVTTGTGENAQTTYEVQAYDADQWAAAKKSFSETSYNESYKDAYSAASAESFKFDTASSLSGVVKGDFLTVNTGGSSISQTTSEIQSTATESANKVHGSAFVSSETITVAAGETKTHAGSGRTFSEAGTYTVNSDGKTNSEWQRDYDETYNSVFAAAATGGSNSSQSNVIVEGIGNIANVGTQETSMFQVDLMARNATGEATENGTASGSSSATLNTVSNANVTSSQFASAFIQSFAPNDIPDALLATPPAAGFTAAVSTTP